jgi:hypothetical protein
VTADSLRQIAANSTNKRFVGPISDDELGARLFDAGESIGACRTAAQQQGWRKASQRHYRGQEAYLAAMYQASTDGESVDWNVVYKVIDGGRW